MIVQDTIEVSTSGRGTRDLSGEIQRAVLDSGIATGVCHVFIHHTSASLMLCENADPDVRRDLETFMAQLVPDGSPMFRHNTEGDDDMPAHVRSILTGASLSVPITGGRLALGTWQGIFLWEHRAQGHRRRVTVTIQGE